MVFQHKDIYVNAYSITKKMHETIIECVLIWLNHHTKKQCHLNSQGTHEEPQTLQRIKDTAAILYNVLMDRNIANR